MSEIQAIVFSIGGERYGVRVSQVQSIERMLPITSVPNTLPFIRGVMNLRGVVTPVIDLRERFGLAVTDDAGATRIIVVDVGGVTVGLVVDSVANVETLDEDAIEAPPELVGGLQAVYLDGIVRIGDGLLIMLNLTKILSDAQADQLRAVAEFSSSEYTAAT